MEKYRINDEFLKRRIIENADMSKHTSFKTGGSADYALFPQSVDELKTEVEALKKENIPYIVIGRGSNVLVSDSGIREVVVFSEKLKGISLSGHNITAASGVSMSEIANFAMKNSLCGMEFMSGIPGSVGGGVYMNAGAYGAEIADIITGAEVLTETGEIKVLEKQDMCLGYRTSVFCGSGDIILGASFELKDGKKDLIKAEMTELNRQRRKKQPLEYPSAGSTFKRPEGYFAGKLIEDAGLKGFRIGGAMVSSKHCGFIVNYDKATSMDIYMLINHVRKTVMEKFGVMLEPEVKMVGKFDDEL